MKPYKVTIPKTESPGEALFAFHCKLHGLTPQREWHFARPRRWRFDFAFPTPGIAVEIEGGTWGNGRHNRGGGFEGDCKKYNAAALAGWRVFRFTTEMVKSSEAINTILEALNGSQVRPAVN